MKCLTFEEIERIAKIGTRIQDDMGTYELVAVSQTQNADRWILVTGIGGNTDIPPRHFIVVRNPKMTTNQLSIGQIS